MILLNPIDNTDLPEGMRKLDHATDLQIALAGGEKPPSTPPAYAVPSLDYSPEPPVNSYKSSWQAARADKPLVFWYLVCHAFLKEIEVCPDDG